MKVSLQQLSDVGVIAVIRSPSAESAILGVEALVRGGVTGIEITYSTPDAPGVIRNLRAQYGQKILLGAGTVLNEAQAQEAVSAGAEFLVSPGATSEIAEAMSRTGATVMLGALTPTEVMNALKLGADVVKIFPAGLSGPKLISSLRGPFPDVAFMPTGGVSADNLDQWLSVGAVAVGAGSELCSTADLEQGRFEKIEERAAAFSAQYRRIHKGENQND